MASPLVCVVYVYEQFIQRHYIILSVSLTVEKWQLDGVLTDVSVCVCVSACKKGSEKQFLKNCYTFPSEAHKLQ